MKYSLVFLITIFGISLSLKLPSYIVPCRRGPDFGKCAVESAKRVIPEIAKGEKMFKIPSMMPLRVPLVELKNQNLEMKIKSLEIHGLETMEPLNFDFDFEKRTGTTLTRANRLVLLGNYEIKGKISVIPVEGQGPLNITLIDGEYKYDLKWNLIKKAGVEYIDRVAGDFDFKLGGAHYKLDNLFSGNDMLGQQVNTFLNEEWAEVMETFKPSISMTMQLIYAQISRNLYTQVPYDDLFLN